MNCPAFTRILVIGMFCFLVAPLFDYQRPVYSPKFIGELRKNFQDKDLGHLYTGLVFGVGRWIPEKVKKDFIFFNLLHILSPGGLHLSALLALLLFSRLKKGVTFMLFVLFFWIEGFFPLKRVIVFRMVGYLSPELSLEARFYLTCLIALLCGHFYLSPLSFTYSFIFWGTIITTPGGFKNKLMGLILANYFVAFLQTTPINFLGSVMGQALTLVYTIAFIPIVILSLFWQWDWIEKILGLLVHGTSWLHELLSFWPSTEVTFLEAYLILCFTYFKWRKY
jgi:hypothetical protein